MEEKKPKNLKISKKLKNVKKSKKVQELQKKLENPQNNPKISQKIIKTKKKLKTSKISKKSKNLKKSRKISFFFIFFLSEIFLNIFLWRRKKKCYPLSFSIFGRTEDGRTEEILVSNIGCHYYPN